MHHEDSLPCVAVLLPSWNTKDHTIAFLESMVLQDYPHSCVELVVVDNGSSDGSPEAIEQWCESRGRELRRCQSIENERNLGIAQAYNRALSACDQEAEFVVRSESDVLWPRCTLSKIVSTFASDQRIGIVGAKGIKASNPGEIDHAAREMNWWNGSLREMDPGDVTDCDCTFGATLAIRRKVLGKLGWFFRADRFFASELELCTRVKRHGWRVVCAPEVEVLHEMAASSGQIDRKRFSLLSAFESSEFFMGSARWPGKPVLLSSLLIRGLADLVFGRPEPISGFLRAAVWHWTKWKRALPWGGDDLDSLLDWLEH